MNTAAIIINSLCVRRVRVPVVQDVSLSIAPGECVGLIGPNGAGKTTLMRAMLGLQRHSGASSLVKMSASARGRHVAWLPQSREIAWPVDVETLVGLGRMPHRSSGQAMTDQDRRAVQNALTRMGLQSFAHRTATDLSGGEQARVLIARALAQQTQFLLADEPVAGLDPQHQIATMQVFAGLAAEGKGVLVSIHDLGLAARHCTRLLVMEEGRLVDDGPPRAVLTTERLAKTFRVRAYIDDGEHGLIVQPLDEVFA